MAVSDPLFRSRRLSLRTLRTRPGLRVLRADSSEIAITPRAIDLLVALVERAGRVVAKSELFELVWPNVVVEENYIEKQISTLRKLLGTQVIETVPGRGYKFTLRQRDLVTDAVNAALPPGNLAARLPPLCGRLEDMVALARLLEQHPIVSIVGPGGTGKTRVGIAVAHAMRETYADGARIVAVEGTLSGRVDPRG
jgi:DNA-binding winged helix-turn-helix (wHTH) protein